MDIIDPMVQPIELKSSFPMKVANDVQSSTTKVWEILTASNHGNVESVSNLLSKCPELIYAQYNYTPPIYFAVREGHVELTNFLLEGGALDPSYKTYPFLDTLLMFANDRGYVKISNLLKDYLAHPERCRYKGDNGEIDYGKTNEEIDFEKAVDKEYLELTEKMLSANPSLALNETFFWSEGIMMMPAKAGNHQMLNLLTKYGAKVPKILKWAQFYYFERFETAAFLLKNGMDPNVMSWHHVTLLHDMAQKGNIPKAELLLTHGAAIDAIDEEYRSTPLGMAVRWGNIEMVDFLIRNGADTNKSGAAWSTPLAWVRKNGFNDIESRLVKAGAVA